MLTDFLELWPSSQKGILPKSNKLQTINVIKICEKLRLAITQVCNGLQRTLDVARRRSRDELTFRSISGLCYTTLRIHEVQVNDLLNKSKELVAQSRDWSTMQVKKRSQPSKCLISYSTKKKRRATIEQSVQDISITNYTELLDESNKFVEWGHKAEILNGKISKTNGHSRTTCIHIREITINEIETNNEQFLDDEDDGFGTNTADDLATFMRLVEEESVGQTSVAKAQKRRAIETTEVCEKKSKICEDQLAIATLEEKAENKKVVESSNVCGKSKCNQGLQNDTCQDVELPEIEIARCAVSNNEEIMHCMPAIENNCEKNNSDDFSEHLNDTTFDDVQKISKPEAHVQDNAASAANISCNSYKDLACGRLSNKRNFKSRNIITDERIGLTEAEMREQLQTRINIPMKIRKLRAKIKFNTRNYLTSTKYYERILPAASELLTKLSRNCIAMSKFKVRNKGKLTNCESAPNESTTYRNLLYDIFNCEITEHLATQIYKNWNKVGKSNATVANSLRNRALLDVEQQEMPYYNELIISTTNATSNHINNNNIIYNNNNNLERANDNTSSTGTQDECGTYNIMIKLLHLWRTEKFVDDSISVDYIFPQNTTSRKVAAKGFGDLLKLAAKKFIVLIAMEHTKHLQSIKLGAASVKLIQQSKLNGIVEKRPKNGYRTHGN